MSEENVQKFYEFIGEDKELAEKLAEVKSAEDVLVLAKSKNFEFTIEEHDKYIDEISVNSEELSDDEVDAAVGGSIIGDIIDATKIQQFRVKCKKCGWQSEWYGILEKYKYSAIIGLHMATNKNHTSFKMEWKR